MADNQPQGRPVEAGGGRRSPVSWRWQRAERTSAAARLTGAGEVAPGSPESPQGASLRHGPVSAAVLRPDESGTESTTCFGARFE